MSEYALGRVVTDQVMRGAERWKLSIGTLVNGLRAVFQENLQRPSACLQVNIYRQPTKLYDIDMMHLLEHLMVRRLTALGFRGQKNYLFQHVDEAASGGGWTFENSICLGLQCLPNQVSQMLQHLCRAAKAKWITRNSFEIERQRIIGELSAEKSSIANVAYNTWLRGMFSRSPFSRPLGGLPEYMARVSYEEILEFRDQLLDPQNIVVGASGKINSDSVMRIVARELGDISVRQSDEIVAKAPSAHPGIHLKQRKGNGLTAFIIGQRVEENPEISAYRMGADFDGLASQFVTLLLGQMWNSNSSREGHDLGLYDVSTGGESYIDAETLWLAGETREPDTINKVVRTYIRDIARLKRHGPTTRELNRAKRNLLGHIMVGSQSLKRRTIVSCGAVHAEGSFETYAAYVGQIKRVTPALIRHWVNRHLAPNCSRLTIVGNVKDFVPFRTIERFCGML